MLYLRDLPKLEAIEQRVRRYPEVDPAAVASYLVVRRVADDLSAMTDSCLAKYRMSQGRFSVLMLLNREPDNPASPSDLAEKAGVTRATMTGLLDGLQRDRLIEREADKEDRRMLLVRLTARGRKLLDGLAPEYYRTMAAQMHGLSDSEKKQLIHLLHKLSAGMPATRKPEPESSPT